MKNIILIGPPGSGKGTQAKLISQELGLIHISTGDLIRKEQAENTKIGNLATQLSDKGNFLPDNIVTTIVKQVIIDNPNSLGFIFDGFPRTVDQAKSLDDFLVARRTPISKIISLEISDEIITSRLLERASIENRPDDTPEVIITRLKAYVSKTIPVINYYSNSNLFVNNRSVTNIDASLSKEIVNESIMGEILLGA